MKQFLDRVLINLRDEDVVREMMDVKKKKYCRCGVVCTTNEKSGTRDHVGSFSREIRCRGRGALVPPRPLQ